VDSATKVAHLWAGNDKVNRPIIKVLACPRILYISNSETGEGCDKVEGATCVFKVEGVF
jgi:hypothetical protein